MAVSALRCWLVIDMSSAYEAMSIWGMGGVGMSCIYKLKSVGDRTDPWGTPFLKFLAMDFWPLKMIWAVLPARKLVSHLLVLFCIFVLSILSVRLCLGTASNALLMSSVTRTVLSGLRLFIPSSVFWVSWVRRVLVECCGLKPCCVGASGMWGEVSVRTSLSITLLP